METHHHRSFGSQRVRWILASAILGSLTMLAVLTAALLEAPEAVIVGVCVGGLAATLTASFLSLRFR